MGDDNDEYIYQTKSLAELHGGKLSKKRNLISQFERNYDNFEIKKIEKEDFRTVISLTEHWRLEHLDDTRVENERKAINRALNHYCELGFEGLMLMAGGELKAYAVFSRINSNSYTVQFEKADLECKGASQVITNQTAKYLLDKCEFINREQDLGIEGLRQTVLYADSDAQGLLSGPEGINKFIFSSEREKQILTVLYFRPGGKENCFSR